MSGKKFNCTSLTGKTAITVSEFTTKMEFSSLALSQASARGMVTQVFVTQSYLQKRTQKNNYL